MTNLSKELCELCGIKPYYKCKNVPCLNFIVDTGICNITESICNPYECKNDYEPDTTHRSWKESQAIYPDFEQPENFVKLFNTPIPNPYITVSGFVTHFALSIWVTHDFLRRLVQLLKNDSHNLRSSEIAQLKQAIREAEWVYE